MMFRLASTWKQFLLPTTLALFVITKDSQAALVLPSSTRNAPAQRRWSLPGRSFLPSSALSFHLPPRSTLTSLQTISNNDNNNDDDNNSSSNDNDENSSSKRIMDWSENVRSFDPNQVRNKDILGINRGANTNSEVDNNGKGMDRVVLIECGAGCCHGRNSTKAAIRACRDAIEFNSVKISSIIPGGYDALKIHVQIGVPDPVTVNFQRIKTDVFPYGTIVSFDIEKGGLRGSNTVNLPGASEKEHMTLAVACITLGYNVDDTTTSDRVTSSPAL